MVYSPPAERITTWAPGSTNRTYPGLLSEGGIPDTSTWATFATLTTNGSDDTTQITNALSGACAAASSSSPQRVMLNAGEFFWNSGGVNQNPMIINASYVELCGTASAADVTTTITKLNGVTNPAPGLNVADANSSRAVLIGSIPRNVEGKGTSTNLSANGTQGDISVTVASASGLTVGMYVLIDELTGAGWNASGTYPSKWDQWRSSNYDACFATYALIADGHVTPSPSNGVGVDGSQNYAPRNDRIRNEIKRIANISGTTITFTSPLHDDYRTANTAQLTPYNANGTENWVNHSGVRNIKFNRFDGGQIVFDGAAYCWIYRCAQQNYIVGTILYNSFRIELRRLYSTVGVVVTGEGGYPIIMDKATSENLIHDCITEHAQKHMVGRASGTASVFGYNYCDRGYQDSTNFVTTGLNSSHYAGSHHVLFEGNWCNQGSSDDTHGGARKITFFRNHLTGFRSTYTTQRSTTRNDRVPDATWEGTMLCCGPMTTSYWFTFIGNVLGVSDFDYTTVDSHSNTWVYENDKFLTADGAVPSIWKMGWGVSPDGSNTIIPGATGGDPQTVTGTKQIIRDGNYDYVTPGVNWHNSAADTFVNSMYLDSKPSYFGSMTWPWVDSLGSTKTYTLPAKDRFDRGFPLEAEAAGGTPPVLLGQACL